MNERINELFEQALEEFNAENKYATFIVPNPLKEKFAELIVLKCAEIADTAEPFLASDLIKQHFGVKE
jgi:hypothetical protein